VTPEPAIPSLDERARRLVARSPAGALAILLSRRPGHPFASLMPYAADGLGRPLLLISGLAVHTRNLEADPRASLLVADAGPGADPLAAERVTLLGDARRLAAGEVADARTLYLARHPDAATWVDFGDFTFWRLEVDEVYMVGGFGVMGWVTAEAYAAAAT
jgi:heme oxygenase (biliverdin-IX-beta and delta-forming)